MVFLKCRPTIVYTQYCVYISFICIPVSLFCCNVLVHGFFNYNYRLAIGFIGFITLACYPPLKYKKLDSVVIIFRFFNTLLLNMLENQMVLLFKNRA